MGAVSLVTVMLKEGEEVVVSVPAGTKTKPLANPPSKGVHGFPKEDWMAE